MTQPVIIDVAVAAVIAVFVIAGACKGLLKSVEGILVLVLAVLGAVLVTRAAAPVVSDLLQPVMEEYVEEWVVEAIEKSASADGERQTDGETARLLEEMLDNLAGDADAGEQLEKIGSLLEQMGIDPKIADDISGAVREKVEEGSVTVAVGLVRAVTDLVIRAAIFLLAFVILTVVMKVAVRALDLVAALPLLRTVNAIGGGLVSALEIVLLLFVAAWAARHLGADLSFAEGTKLCSFFIDHSSLSILSSLL